MKCLAFIIPLLVIAGCATSASTVRQIERQEKYLMSLQQVHEALTDKLAEIGEKIEQGQKDLEALKIQRVVDESSVESLEQPESANGDDSK